MPRVLARTLALRVGWSHGQEPDAERAATPHGPFAGFAELPLTGSDNPSDFDAVLALAEAGTDTDDPTEVIENLREALRREGAPESFDPDVLPEALAAAHVWAREPRPGRTPAVGVSFICVRSGRLWALQAPALPVYLLRDDLLRPLAPDLPLQRPTAGDLEPEIASEHLRDGDAILVCTRCVHESLSGRQVREVLIHANSPETAARRLVSEARKEGAKHPAAAVLFAGLGPAVAHRLRAPATQPRELLEPAPRRRQTGSVALVAGLAALAGTMLGLAAGVWIGLLRPGAAPEPEPGALASQAAIVPEGRPAVTPAAELMPPTPPRPRLEIPAPSANSPAPVPAELPASNAPAPNGPAPAPVGTPTVLNADPVAQPAVLPAEPPRHPLAPELRAGAQVRVRIDAASSQLLLECSRGVLFSRETPQGIPVGESLKVPLVILQRERPPAGELRLLGADRMAATIRGGELDKLLQGETAVLGPLSPGEYELCWWSRQTGALSVPVAVFRLADL